MMLLPKTIGPFTLVRKLGTGGVAESYQGTLAEEGGRTVLIRRVLPYVLQDGVLHGVLHTSAPHTSAPHPNGRLASLEGRVRDLMGIRHPFLVRVLEWVSHEEERFIVEEWAEGVSLERVLHWCRANDQTIPHNVYLNLATQICNGLEALHGRTGEGTQAENVLHLALRPQAAFVTAEGKIILGSYGLVRSPTSLPHGGAPLASRMEYLSPEQTHADQKLTPASDIFALGSLLYEMLTLEPLFRSDSNLQTINRVRRAEITTQLLQVKEIMPGLDKVLYRALSLNPRHRYQRAFVLREDLRGLMAGYSFNTIIEDTRRFIGPLISEGLAMESEAEAADADFDRTADIDGAAFRAHPGEGDQRAGVSVAVLSSTAALAAQALAARHSREDSASSEDLQPRAPMETAPHPSPHSLPPSGPAPLPGEHDENTDATGSSEAPTITGAVLPIAAGGMRLDEAEGRPVEDDADPMVDGLFGDEEEVVFDEDGGSDPLSQQGYDTRLDGRDANEVTEPIPPEHAAEEDEQGPARVQIPTGLAAGPSDSDPHPRLVRDGYLPEPPAPRTEGRPVEARQPDPAAPWGEESARRNVAPAPTVLPHDPSAAEFPRPVAPVVPPPAAPPPLAPLVPDPAVDPNSTQGFLQGHAPLSPTPPSTEPGGPQGGAPPSARLPRPAEPAPPARDPAPPPEEGGGRGALYALLAAGALLVCAGGGYGLSQMGKADRARTPAVVATVTEPPPPAPAPPAPEPPPAPPAPAAETPAPPPAPVVAAAPARPDPAVDGQSPAISRPAPTPRPPAATPPVVRETPRTTPPRTTPTRTVPPAVVAPTTAALVTPLEPEPLNLERYTSSAARGGLTRSDVMALETVPTEDTTYDRSRALLLMNAQRAGDEDGAKRYLDQLMQRPENRYNPIYLADLARYHVNQRHYQTALDNANLAERYWARLPSELVYAKKAEIYEIQASAYQGLFYTSGDDLEMLDRSIRYWEKYREHVSTRSSPTLVTRAEEELTKLRDIRRRLE